MCYDDRDRCALSDFFRRHRGIVRGDRARTEASINAAISSGNGMVWMEKMIANHPERPADVIPFPELKISEQYTYKKVRT